MLKDSVAHDDLGKVQNAKADVGNHIAGYIFMCNTGTKPDCFIYRVFGLPASRMRVVQNIKPNTKLFLFDFDVKLLYGLYVADSSGKLGLEPYAFGGKFPAQVKFSIARDCLPLPEVVFKDVIKENYYSGSKFKQELNDEQVNKLVSLFRPIAAPSPQKPSPAFTHALRSFYQKYMEPSQQVTRYTYLHNERSVPDVPQVASASNYYGQNPMPRPTISPASPVVAPSSLSASRWVAVAAQALNAEGQTSSSMLPISNEPGLNHACMPYNGSNSRGVGYSYRDQVNPSSHQDLPVSNRVMHAYEMPLHSVGSYYQTQGDATLPQTLASGSTVERVDDTYLNYNNRNHPASINYGYTYTHNQGDPALPHLQPSIGANNINHHYNGTTSATFACDHGNQGYYSGHQIPVGTNVQQSNNGANFATLAPDYGNQGYYSGHQTAVGTGVQQSNNVLGVHQPYWPTAPSGYVNQDYYNSTYSSGLPDPSANITAGYPPIGGPGAHVT